MVDVQVLQNLLSLEIFLCLPVSMHKLCEDNLIFLYNFGIDFLSKILNKGCQLDTCTYKISIHTGFYFADSR